MWSPHQLYQQQLAGNRYPMWYPPQPTVSAQQRPPINPTNVMRSEPEQVQMPFRPILPVVGVDYPQLPYGTRHRYL